MNTARFRATAIALTLVSVVAVAACANNDATTEGSSGTVTETKPTDVPTSLLDLSEDAAKNRTEPLPSDLGLVVPDLATLNELSVGAGKDYKKTSEQSIPMGTEFFPWAEGLSYGHETAMEVQSVNEDDLMKLHTANVAFRALVFDTPEAATDAMEAYQRVMGRAVSQADFNEDGSRWASLLYDASSQPLPRISEGMLQKGAVITWVVFQDNVSLSWQPQAVAFAELYLNAILERYPSLAS